MTDADVKDRSEKDQPKDGFQFYWFNWNLTSSPFDQPVFPDELFLEESIVLEVPDDITIPRGPSEWQRVTDSDGKDWEVTSAPCNIRSCFCAAAFREAR